VPQNQELEYALDINSINAGIIEECKPKKKRLAKHSSSFFCKVSYGPPKSVETILLGPAKRCSNFFNIKIAYSYRGRTFAFWTQK
jgi:hypothetical protein